MDDFKKAGVVVLTANDLNAKCVCVKNKTRRKLMKIARKLARRTLKADMEANYATDRRSEGST